MLLSFDAGGTDLAIYQAAGATEPLTERKKVGCIERGDIAVTSAYALNAKYIIHTVGPVWVDGKHKEFDVMELFGETIGRVPLDAAENEALSGNAAIETAINQLYEQDDKDNLLFLLTMLCARMRCEGHALVPFAEVWEGFFSDMDIYQLKEGDAVTLDHDVRLRMDTVTEDKKVE